MKRQFTDSDARGTDPLTAKTGTSGARARDLNRSPFALSLPDRQTLPFVFASPHSGSYFPPSMKQLTRLSAPDLRRSEDSFVHRLFDRAADFGAPLIAATYSRAFLDLNRRPTELDPEMFTPPLDDTAVEASERVRAGLGLIPRIITNQLPIYQGKLPQSEANRRLDGIYYPYHETLAGLLRDTRRQQGFAVLIDCHSMPSYASIQGQQLRRSGALGHTEPDIVLGDRFGASCHPSVIDFIDDRLTEMGYRTERNIPYAGGYCTEYYGRPEGRIHALQIELNRQLYMDETRISPSRTFETLRQDLTKLMASLCDFRMAGRRQLAAE